MFSSKLCKMFKNIFWQNTSGWLLLVFIREFWEEFRNMSFIEHLRETTYFIVQVKEFQSSNKVKNYFTGAFQAF